MRIRSPQTEMWLACRTGQGRASSLDRVAAAGGPFPANHGLAQFLSFILSDAAPPEDLPEAAAHGGEEAVGRRLLHRVSLKQRSAFALHLLCLRGEDDFSLAESHLRAVLCFKVLTLNLILSIWRIRECSVLLPMRFLVESGGMAHSFPGYISQTWIFSLKPWKKKINKTSHSLWTQSGG